MANLSPPARSESPAGRSPEHAGGRVLVVDDEPGILRSFARLLVSVGHSVESAPDGLVAADLFDRERFDVIVSDISMPGMDGLALLRKIRARDLDVPVILVTASPALESATQAIEHGAFRYLTKPVEPVDLREAVDQAVRLHRMARLRREAVVLLGGLGMVAGDRAGLEAKLDLALHGLWMAYQPIVSWARKEVFAYEALLRSEEPALPHPGAVLTAAERLGRLHELGRTVRRHVSAAGAAAPAHRLFVNLHAQDLLDDALYAEGAPLSAMAERVVLEITERAALDAIPDVRARVARLRRLGFRVAVDDLGAGYAGLLSFAQLEPEFVKLDMSLVRDVHREATKRKLIQSMCALCHDMGIAVVAEGVETVEERGALADLGCDLMQGYLFGRPGRELGDAGFSA